METYSTRVLKDAAALVTLGFPVVRIDYQFEGDKPYPIGYFQFEKTKAFEEALALLDAKKLLVEPSLFMFNLHELKSKTTNMYKNPSNQFAKNC